MLNKICEKYCVNFIRITFMGRTAECCGGNVNNANACSINKDLYENHVLRLTKKELCSATELSEDKLMRVLCRAEFSNIRRIKDKEHRAYIEVTPKDLDNLRMWKQRGGPQCEI